MKFITRYRGVKITRWNSQYYFGDQLHTPLFNCSSLQECCDFISRHVPII